MVLLVLSIVFLQNLLDLLEDVMNLLNEFGGFVDLKIIITHNLGDGVWPIMEWENILMGFVKAFFLQMKPNFFSHLKLMWHPVLIMVLLVLSIGFLQNMMEPLVDVLNMFNKTSGFFIL